MGILALPTLRKLPFFLHLKLALFQTAWFILKIFPFRFHNDTLLFVHDFYVVSITQFNSHIFWKCVYLLYPQVSNTRNPYDIPIPNEFFMSKVIFPHIHLSIFHSNIKYTVSLVSRWKKKYSLNHLEPSIVFAVSAFPSNSCFLIIISYLAFFPNQSLLLTLAIIEQRLSKYHMATFFKVLYIEFCELESMSINIFRLGEFSSIILLKFFSVPLTWASSPSYIPIFLDFVLFIVSQES